MTQSTATREGEPYWFSKNKIGRHLAYPLKRSLLDTALRSASVYDIVHSVRYLGHTNSNTVMDAWFMPEWMPCHPAVRGRSQITLWAVPVEQRHATEQLIVAEGLDTLCHWLDRTRSEGNVWRGMEHVITFEVLGGTLRVSDR